MILSRILIVALRIFFKVMVKTLKEHCEKKFGYFINVDIDKNEDGSMKLCLPQVPEEELLEQLPNVSIVTITKNRGEFAGIMLHNWLNIYYPREKLEWVILDDSDPDYPYQLEDYIPHDDPNIKFYRYNEHLKIADKRNKAVQLTNYEYIVHMDDDDYYFPDSVLAKIRIIDHYNCSGVLSMPLGVYDLMERKSAIFSISSKNGMDCNDVPEASLAYKKQYWRNHPFISVTEKGNSEGVGFIGKRHNKWANVHFMFNMISITHSTNVTNHNRRVDVQTDEENIGKFEDIFPSSFNYNLENVRKFLEADYKPPID